MEKEKSKIQEVSEGIAGVCIILVGTVEQIFLGKNAPEGDWSRVAIAINLLFRVFLVAGVFWLVSWPFVALFHKKIPDKSINKSVFYVCVAVAAVINVVTMACNALCYFNFNNFCFKQLLG